MQLDCNVPIYPQSNHIDITFPHVQNMVLHKDLDLECILANEMVADLLY